MALTPRCGDSFPAGGDAPTHAPTFSLSLTLAGSGPSPLSSQASLTPVPLSGVPCRSACHRGPGGKPSMPARPPASPSPESKRREPGRVSADPTRSPPLATTESPLALVPRKALTQSHHGHPGSLPPTSPPQGRKCSIKARLPALPRLLIFFPASRKSPSALSLRVYLPALPSSSREIPGL